MCGRVCARARVCIYNTIIHIYMHIQLYLYNYDRNIRI